MDNQNRIDEYALYLAAYATVVDSKIYDDEYVLIKNAILSNEYGEDVVNKVLGILGDDDNKVSLEIIYSQLKTLKEEEKKEALSLSAFIVCADKNFDDDERVFLTNTCNEIGLKESVIDEIVSQALRDKTITEENIETTRKRHGQGFYKFLASVTSGSFQERMKEQYNKCLLSGEDYSNAVKEMKEIADEDLTFAEKSLKVVSQDLLELSKSMDTNTSEVKKSTEKFVESNKTNGDETIISFLSELKKQIKEFANESKESASITLKKKRAALSNYTISFMGRTKAGKSTLHSVILGGVNKEFIGVGKERTTRYNRVYQWNGIRIIDTPGIGAPGGKQDTEIAADIIDETDLICYVVTSDSVQEVEFDFLKGIREHNTPVIVLLNKKENILYPEFKRKRFLENPNKWYTTNDKDSLEGSIKRIKEYADKYYNNTYFEIFPVQLLAAQQSLVEENKIDKKKFYDGSHLEQFLDAIRIQILQEGKLKRSKTMLDGTLFSFYSYKNALEKRKDGVKKFTHEFSCKKETAFSKIHELGNKASESLRRGLNEEFNSFIQNDVQLFAQQNYNAKKDIEKNWKKFLKDSQLESRLKTRFENEVHEFQTGVESIITQMTENMEFAMNSLESASFGFDFKGITDARFWTALTGSTIGVAGAIVTAILGVSNPIGWVITGVGIVVGLFSGLFKSKQEKIRIATEKLYNSISSAVKENQNKTVNDMVYKFDKMKEKLLISLIDTFDDIEICLGEIEEKLSNTIKKLNTEINELNILYAIRIVNYSNGKKYFDIYNKETYKELKVLRTFGKEMKILFSEKIPMNTKKLSLELQETILSEAK